MEPTSIIVQQKGNDLFAVDADSTLGDFSTVLTLLVIMFINMQGQTMEMQLTMDSPDFQKFLKTSNATSDDLLNRPGNFYNYAKVYRKFNVRCKICLLDRRSTADTQHCQKRLLI